MDSFRRESIPRLVLYDSIALQRHHLVFFTAIKLVNENGSGVINDA